WSFVSTSGGYWLDGRSRWYWKRFLLKDASKRRIRWAARRR
ncbi:MAG: hypothetical protein AVDCRST_MAG43-260, partial [uncultured Thermomicrobiales bacterium]